MPSKSLARSRSTGFELAVDDGVLQGGVREDRVHQRGDMERILVVEQHAGAVHRRRHRRGRVGQHRHLLVERFDQRHAEAFVLAGAQEQVGQLVVGDQLVIRDMADEVDVREAELVDQVGRAPRSSVRTG